MLKNHKGIILFILIILVLVTGCQRELPSIQTMKDLENKKIGVYTGSEYDTILKEHIKGATPQYYNSYSDQIAALKSGKIDGFLTDEPLAKEILREHPDLKILEEKLTEDSYAFALNPKLTELEKEISSEIKKMKENGTLQKLEEKWMGNEEEKKVLDTYEYETNGKKITFAAVSGNAPFAYYKNNELVGYDIEVIKMVCKELKYELEIIDMAFEGVIPALKSGKIDIAGTSIIVTEERKKSVLFAEPDYTGGIVIVVRGS